MLHKKLFYVKQKKVNVKQKSVLRRQKQDDSAQKNYFVLKKVIIFSRTVRHTNVLWKLNYL